MSLGLAAPLWLLGLLGLLAPLVLHLLARGRGRRVRVGSVRLLTESPPRRPRRLQLQRPLLLALRCLLLALVALALAGPRLRREAAIAAAPRPWILTEPGVDADSIEAVHRAAAAGAKVRLLAPGLPKTRAAETAALPDLATVPGGVWSLLREAAATAPKGTRFVVVTSGRLAALRGERPAFANAVEWHEVPDSRVSRGAARAVRGADRTVPRRLPVAVLAATGREGDARYVRTGLAAAAEAAGVQLEILETSARPAALTFWLADAPPPAAVLAAVRDGGVLVTDSGAPEERCGGTFVAVAMRELAPDAVLGSVALHRCGAAGPTASTREESTPAPERSGATPGPVGAASEPRRATWVADSGRAVLVEQTLGRGRWLRFASRFDPAWSELVLSPAFPEWLRDLLRTSAGGEARAETPASDHRGDGGQGRPAAAVSAHRERSTPARSPAPASPTPERAAWLLLFSLLLAERWLATRR